MRMTAKWQFNNLDKVVPAMRVRASQAVRKTAFDVQYGAQARVPVDTGAAKASIHVVVGDESGYPEAITQAQDLYHVRHPNHDLEFFDEVASTKSEVKALVVVAVKYGWFIENGTSKAAAQPFLAPAVSAAEQPFIEALKAAILQAAQDTSQ